MQKLCTETVHKLAFCAPGQEVGAVSTGGGRTCRCTSQSKLMYICRRFVGPASPNVLVLRVSAAAPYSRSSPLSPLSSPISHTDASEAPPAAVVRGERRERTASRSKQRRSTGERGCDAASRQTGGSEVVRANFVEASPYFVLHGLSDAPGVACSFPTTIPASFTILTRMNGSMYLEHSQSDENPR